MERRKFGKSMNTKQGSNPRSIAMLIASAYNKYLTREYLLGLSNLELFQLIPRCMEYDLKKQLGIVY
jgi:hypothetical protein